MYMLSCLFLDALVRGLDLVATDHQDTNKWVQHYNKSHSFMSEQLLVIIVVGRSEPITAIKINLIRNH
jgi:hypothetical protein